MGIRESTYQCIAITSKNVHVRGTIVSELISADCFSPV